MSKLIPVTECGRTVYLDTDSVALIRPHVSLATSSNVLLKSGLCLLIEEEPAALHRMVVEARTHPHAPCAPSSPSTPTHRAS